MILMFHLFDPAVPIRDNNSFLAYLAFRDRKNLASAAACLLANRPRQALMGLEGEVSSTLPDYEAIADSLDCRSCGLPSSYYWRVLLR